MKVKRTRQRGVGMIEVLVALLVLAIGVLGYAGLQLSALKGAETAHVRARATALARESLERMMVNPEAAAFYQDANAWSGAAPSAGQEPAGRLDCIGNRECSSDDMAKWDIQQLTWQAANTLPAGRIRVSSCAMSGAPSRCVVVAWEGQAADQCMTSSGIETGEDSKCVVMEVMQ